MPTLPNKINLEILLIADMPNNVIITDNTNWSNLGINSNDVAMAVKIETPVSLLYMPSYYNIPTSLNNDITKTTPFNYKTKLGVSAIADFLVDNKKCFINGMYTVSVMVAYKQGLNIEYKEYIFKKDISYKKTKIKISQYPECLCATFKSIDTTDYSNTEELSYSHTIHYPADVNEADVVTTLKDYLDNRLATGVYTSTVQTKRNTIIDDVYKIQQTLNGSYSVNADCDTICDIKCGIEKMNDKYNELCGCDKHEADILKDKLNAIMRYIVFYNFFNGCGNTDLSNDYIKNIKAIIGDCKCDCDCSDKNGWISGMCGSSGGSEFDPSSIINYINNHLTQINNAINNINSDINTINTTISNILSSSWLDGLNTACLTSKGFPNTGTSKDKYQFILDTLCSLMTDINKEPEAHNDIITTQINNSKSYNVTSNDFFSSDVTVTIVTQAINGTATVMGDNKTITYSPNPNWVGTDVVTYKITDQHNQTSNATLTIIVNPVQAFSCSTVTPSYNASIYSVGTNLQIAISNQSDIGTNVLTAKQFNIYILDNSNNILNSYSVSGNTSTNPTIWTSPVPILSTWAKVRILMSITTASQSGGLCGTTTYETPTLFSLTDVSISWFDGTTIPICLGILNTDNETQKKNKLMSAICNAITSINTINGISGDGSTANKIKLGGALTENTTINGAGVYKFTFNELKSFSNTTGGANEGTYQKSLNSHIMPENYNGNDGFNIIEETAKIKLNNLYLDNGRGIGHTQSALTLELKDNQSSSSAIKNGSHVCNRFDYIEVAIPNATSDITLEMQQGGAANTIRALANVFMATNLNSHNPLYKVNISHFINNAIVANPDVGTPLNYYDTFVQQYIGKAKGDGGYTAPSGTFGNSYGVYQAGENDKNAFFGEIKYYSGLTNASDARSKDVIGNFTKGLDVVKQINPIEFKRKAGFGNTEIKQIGIIAQEIEEILPEAITISKEFGIDDFRSYNSDAMIYLLLNSIKELSNKVDEQEKKINELILNK